MSNLKRETNSRKVRLWEVRDRRGLLDLQDVLGVRNDWHEPDEQDVEVEIIGNHFDNAMGAIDDNDHDDNGEFTVIIYQGGKEVSRVNLATLFAIGCQ